MLSWEDALALVLEHARPTGRTVEVPAQEAVGLALAEDVASDVDSPPYAKSLVDGYAVRTADLASGQAVLEVIEEITAGRVPSQSVGPGQASRVMTGAPVPDGADAMVMVECTRLFGPGIDGRERVEIEVRQIRAGQNILQCGREMRRGERVLEAGQTIRPQEVGLLASVGRVRVRVGAPPAVAILPTGDELVEPPTMPAAGQIRNSNGPMLAAQVARAGGAAHYTGIVRDTLEELREKITTSLQHEVVLLSGGVSAGKLDLVPAVLAELGVEQVFHKVALRPGKPLWFGVKQGDTPTLVFGLPGNPVSGFVCFELFVRPALRRLAGHRGATLPRYPVPLAEAWEHRGDRATFWPARFERCDGRLAVAPLPWAGSADLRTLTRADALIYSPPGDRVCSPGDAVEVVVA